MVMFLFSNESPVSPGCNLLIISIFLFYASLFFALKMYETKFYFTVASGTLNERVFCIGQQSENNLSIIAKRIFRGFSQGRLQEMEIFRPNS